MTLGGLFISYETYRTETKRGWDGGKQAFDTKGRSPWDEALYEKLQKENDEELEGYKKEEEEAAEKAGDTEVQAARGKRAEFWARVGDKV